MKLTCPLALALAIALTGDAPPAGSEVPGRPQQPINTSPGIDRRGIAGLAARAQDLERAASGARSVGNLWLEAGRLKREGANVSQIEWQISELEATLRRNPHDTTAKRHLLNNLQYEIQRLKNRQR